MKKIKNIVVIIFLLTIILVTTKAYGQGCMVYGSTATQSTYKYVYLYDAETKLFITTPVIDYQFNFKLDESLKQKILILSLNSKLFKTYKELLESTDNEYLNGARMIAIEDTVKITVKEDPKNAIVEAKVLNKNIDDMRLSIKSKQYSLFFENHPDSPISLVFLKTLTKYYFNGSPIFTIQECKESYDKLSARIKNSDEGKELFRIINK